jgi:RNA polymerase sigma factor (sigma-70 family)
MATVLSPESSGTLEVQVEVPLVVPVGEGKPKRVRDILEQTYAPGSPQYDTSLAVAYRILRDWQLAEDAVQETFLAMEKRGKYQFRNELSSGGIPKNPSLAKFWYNSLRRTCIDIMRENEREHVGLEGFEKDNRAYDPFTLCCTYEAKARLDQAVSRLENQGVYRKLIDLRKQGVKFTEISEMLGVNISTLKRRICYSKRRLKDDLPEEYHWVLDTF